MKSRQQTAENSGNTLNKLDPIVRDLDLTEVGYYLRNRERRSKRYTNWALAAYRAWLNELRNGRYSDPPNVVVDGVFHAHLLHTEKFLRDCMRLFGRILCHKPTHSFLKQRAKSRRSVRRSVRR